MQFNTAPLYLPPRPETIDASPVDSLPIIGEKSDIEIAYNYFPNNKNAIKMSGNHGHIHDNVSLKGDIQMGDDGGVGPTNSLSDSNVIENNTIEKNIVNKNKYLESFSCKKTFDNT